MQTYFSTLVLPTATAVSLFFMNACTSISGPSTGTVEKADFGKTTAGKVTEIYTLKNATGVVAKVTTFGATLVQLHVPDNDGNLADVVNGCDTVAGYQGEDNQYFGCTTGRVCNRIAKPLCSRPLAVQCASRL